MSRPHSLLNAVALALVIILTSALPSLALKGPKAVFENTEIIKSGIREGKPVTVEYKLTNAGDMNLIIDKVVPSCGCTIPKFDPIIKPGQKGTIKLVLDTEGITGAFRKTAVVSTNDPANPYVNLVLLGDTVSNIVVDKGRRLSLVGCLSETITNTATISDPDGKPVFIAGVENPMPDYVDASLKPVKGTGKYQLTVTSKAKKMVEFAGPIFLRMPNGSKISIYVVADIKGAFKVRPHAVYFGAVPNAGPAPVRGIVVQKACTQKLTLDKILVNREHFKITETWQKPGEKLYLEITPRLEGLPKGPFEEGMAIVASGEKFVVNLKGVVR